MTTLNVNKWQTAAGTTVNNVVQSKAFHYATYQAYTEPGSGTAFDTGLTLSITPKYSTSKIYVTVTANLFNYGSSSVCRARIKRTGPATVYSASSTGSQSSGWTTTHYISVPTVAADMGMNHNIQWFDSPASTSTCTYTLQIAGNSAGIVSGINGSGTWGSGWAASSQIILMEIAQ
jgi:hypothetical protein